MTQNPHSEHTKNLCLKVASKTGLMAKTIETVLAGRQNPVRTQDDAARLLFQQLPIIAQEYGARQKLAGHVLKECVSLVLEKFKTIGINEIREAYRLKSAGHLQAPGSEMWGGEFNADQIGKVLTAYVDHRRRIIDAYLKEVEAQKERERSEYRRREFDKKFPNMIEKARKEKTDWRDIPEYWYVAAMKRGMIEFEDGEAQLIFEEAKELAKMEYSEEYENASPIKKIKLQAAALGHGDDLEFRAKLYARKISVFRKLILK